MPAFSNTRPLDQAHDAAATACAGVIGAGPGRAHEAAGRAVGQRCAGRQIGLDCFEGRAQVVAQRSNQACACLLLRSCRQFL